MALKGKIDDFGIADILQLIGQQQRAGILTVQSRGRIAEIFFVKGMISKVNPLYASPKRSPLGDSLVRAQLISEENLQRCLRRQQQTLKSMEEALIDLQLVTQGQLQTVCERLIIETLYDTLQWKDGEYEFVIREIEHDERFGNLMGIEYLLLDVLRMIDEGPELSRRLPDDSVVFEKSEEDITESDPVRIEERFGSHEKIIFELVDGIKTVQAITARSLLGHYCTSKGLVNLLDAGLITKKLGTGPEISEKPLLQRKVFQQLFYMGVPLGVMASLICLRLVLGEPHYHWANALSSSKAALAKTQLVSIRNALAVYYLENGRFPGSLRDLIQARVIGAEVLNYPPGVTYRYQLHKNGTYLLE